MKIVCQSCQAKYSIADDKVQGKKVFKIKCKKCGEDILVRGAEGGEAESTGGHAAQEPFTEDEATKVVSSAEASAAADAGWHAVVNGNQEGPFSVQQLRDMVGGGSIDGEAFVWKDGFAEWKPLKDVPELATLVLGGRAAPAGGDLFAGGGAAAGGAAAGGGMFGGDEARARTGAKASSAKGDLFATETASAKGGMFGGAPAEEEVSTSTSAGKGSAAGASAQSMTGARNENSVLFSLASLQAIAGGGTGPAMVSQPGAAGKKPDADASGIIDIKSMGASMGPGSAKSKAVDDLLTVGASSPLGSPLAAPVLAPVPTPSSASPEPDRQAGGGGKSFMVAGVLIALILAAGGLGVAFLLKPSAPATVVVNAPPVPNNNGNNNNGNNGNNNNGNNGNNNNGNNGNNAAAPGTTVADNTAPAPGADPAANRNDRTRDPHAHDPHDTHPATQAGAAGTPATTTTAAPPPATTNSSGCATRCHGNIDCLLRCTAGGGTGGSQPATTTTTTTAPPPGNAPETPSRNDVISAMGRVRSAVVNCASGQTGTATISITFASNGHVTSATASGAPFAGTPAGSCMARAVRSATVPAFSRPSFSVTYPFRI